MFKFLGLAQKILYILLRKKKPELIGEEDVDVFIWLRYTLFTMLFAILVALSIKSFMLGGELVDLEKKYNGKLKEIELLKTQCDKGVTHESNNSNLRK